MEKLKSIHKAIFYISFPFAFISFVLPIYASELGSTPFEIGILYAVFSFFSILIRPMVGLWIDHKGRKSGVMIGLLSFALVNLLFLTGENFYSIFAARVLQSIAASFLWTSLHAMIADVSCTGDRSKNFGYLNQISNRGAFIGSLIGFSILFSGYAGPSMKWVFSVYFGISLLAVIYGVKYGEETMNLRIMTDHRTEEYRIDNSFFRYLGIVGGMAFVKTMKVPIYLLYIRGHITDHFIQISFLFIPGALLSIYMSKRFGILSDRYGRKTLFVFGKMLLAVAIFCIPYIRHYYGFMALQTTLVLAELISSPAESSIVAEITGSKYSGRNYGCYHLITGLGGMMGPLLGSYIYEYVQKDFVFFIQSLVLVILIFISVLVLDKELNRGKEIEWVKGE